jgi:hypothetical protein
MRWNSSGRFLKCYCNRQLCHIRDVKHERMMTSFSEPAVSFPA